MNLQKSELIGTIVKIIDSKNKANIGLTGKIIDETQNTFIIQNHRKKRVIKQQNVFEINKTRINGEQLHGRSEDRIKKR